VSVDNWNTPLPEPFCDFRGYRRCSHTHTVVRECFKGDEASQRKRPKFDSSPRRNPLTDLHQNWQAWLRLWRHPAFCSDRFRGLFLLPKYVILPCHWGDLFLRVLGSSIRLQPTPINGFLHKIRQITSFRVRKCLLGSRWLYFLFKPLNFRKTAI